MEENGLIITSKSGKYRGVLATVFEITDMSAISQVVACDCELAIFYKLKDNGTYIISFVSNKAGVSAIQLVNRLLKEDTTVSASKYESNEEQARFIANNLSCIELE
jgi:hypothetical protein